MFKLVGMFLIAFILSSLSIAKEWRDNRGESIGIWTFKEISDKKIVMLENRGVTKNILFSSLSLEDQNFIGSYFVKELTKDCSENLDVNVFTPKYAGKPFLFKSEVINLSEDFVEDYRKVEPAIRLPSTRFAQVREGESLFGHTGRADSRLLFGLGKERLGDYSKWRCRISEGILELPYGKQ